MKIIRACKVVLIQVTTCMNFTLTCKFYGRGKPKDQRMDELN